jgi:hypothetical protein
LPTRLQKRLAFRQSSSSANCCRHAEVSETLLGLKVVTLGSPNRYHYPRALQMSGVCYRRYGHRAISAESRRLACEAYDQGPGGGCPGSSDFGGQYVAHTSSPPSGRRSDADDNAMRCSPGNQERQGGPLRVSRHTCTPFVLDGVAEPRWLTEDCTSRDAEAWMTCLLDCREEGSLGVSLGEGASIARLSQRIGDSFLEAHGPPFLPCSGPRCPFQPGLSGRQVRLP